MLLKTDPIAFKMKRNRNRIGTWVALSLNFVILIGSANQIFYSLGDLFFKISSRWSEIEVNSQSKSNWGFPKHTKKTELQGEPWRQLWSGGRCHYRTGGAWGRAGWRLRGVSAASPRPTWAVTSLTALGKSSLFAFDSKMPLYFFPCSSSQCTDFTLEASRSNFSNTYFFSLIGLNINDKNCSPFINIFSHSGDPIWFILTPLICVCHLFSSCAECHLQIDVAVCIQQDTISYIAEMNFQRMRKDTEMTS